MSCIQSRRYCKRSPVPWNHCMTSGRDLLGTQKIQGIKSNTVYNDIQLSWFKICPNTGVNQVFFSFSSHPTAMKPDPPQRCPHADRIPFASLAHSRPGNQKSLGQGDVLWLVPCFVSPFQLTRWGCAPSFSIEETGGGIVLLVYFVLHW